MSPRNAIADSRRRRRLITASWLLALTILTISLIYWEKTAILYILATLGVTALLGVVAFADLGHAEKGSTDTTA
jgi:hypothetical protein